MILHVDMDAFFASVEQLDAPWLKGSPLVVGGDSDRGVVAAASYEARRFGIHSAMPMFQARRKCPDLVVMPPRRHRYKSFSQKAMAVLHGISPLVEQVSIDEAYVDISGCERLMGEPSEIGRIVKSGIEKATDLTCSVGIAELKFLAKIASDINKPNGLFIILPQETEVFIQSLPLKKIPGVGPRTQEKLNQMGIRTLGEIRKLSKKAVTARFGKYGERLLQLANGVDHATVRPHRPAKSISSESTLSKNTQDRGEIKRILLAHCQTVGRQLRAKKRFAKTITIKIKFNDFKIQTRSTTLTAPVCDTRTIYQTACELMDQAVLSRPVRLVGVGTSNFENRRHPKQVPLFEDRKKTPSTPSWTNADLAVDAITAKFGRKSITKATLTPPKKQPK